jgi:sugar porter (SP) family MFS transporter
MKRREENLIYLIFLSMVAALGGFLFGYDTAVISGTVTRVVAQFGLDSLQTGWFVGSALIGSIAGVISGGMISDRIGRKRSMIMSALLFTISALGCAISTSFAQLVLYRVIGGIGIGMVSIISPMYISELSVPRYRGSLVSLYQLAITIGFLGAYLVNFRLLTLSESSYAPGSPLMQKIFIQEVWRAMFGAEALPAATFLLVIFFIPESPRWLVIRQNEQGASSILQRIFRNPEHVRAQIREIKSLAGEKGKSEWKQIREPGLLRAILIGAAIAILGQFMGVNAVLYYGPKIFEDSGLSSGDSLFYQVLVGLVNALTTVVALIIIDKVGRKQLVYWGVSGMILALLAIAFYFTLSEKLGLSSVFLLAFFLFYIFCTAISISAVIFVFLSELYPTRVRGLAMSIAGLSLWVGTYLIGQLTPWMLETLGPAGTFFLFAGMCLPYMWIIRNKVPETAGKSLEDIEREWIR